MAGLSPATREALVRAAEKMQRESLARALGRRAELAREEAAVMALDRRSVVRRKG
jgi:hypothetical protein